MHTIHKYYLRPTDRPYERTFNIGATERYCSTLPLYHKSSHYKCVRVSVTMSIQKTTQVCIDYLPTYPPTLAHAAIVASVTVKATSTAPCSNKSIILPTVSNIHAMLNINGVAVWMLTWKVRQK